MRTILFYIPHELGGVPVLGFGWALLAWVLIAAGIVIWLVRLPNWKEGVVAYAPLLAIVAVALVFLLPRLEEHGDTGEAIGLPIRGYGVMLLCAIVSGVGAALYRARQMGVDPEHVFSLAFWMFLAGMVGARLAYIVLKPGEFFAADQALGETLVKLVNITEGGLVVFGALLAVVPAAVLYLRRVRVPVLAMCDLIAPSMVLGLAIGRLGCFLHGCCYGGICQELPWGVYFPGAARHESPPYLYEKSLGILHGFRIHEDAEKRVEVSLVLPESDAEQQGLKKGDVITAINTHELAGYDDARDRLVSASPAILVRTADGRNLGWSVREFPPATPLALHPAQIYASISAALVFAVLWLYYPLRRHDGEVFSLLLILGGLTRFLEEIVRDDEGAFFLNMTVSQNICLVMLLAGVLLLVWVSRMPRTLAWPVQRALA